MISNRGCKQSIMLYQYYSFFDLPLWPYYLDFLWCAPSAVVHFTLYLKRQTHAPPLLLSSFKSLHSSLGLDIITLSCTRRFAITTSTAHQSGKHTNRRNRHS